MKINNKMLSLPPYISTSWNHVLALHLKGSALVVCLTDGSTIEIPELRPEILETIFNAHASYLDRQSTQERPTSIQQMKSNIPFIASSTSQETESDFPFRLGFGTFDTLGSALQHNPSQSQAPDLPPEILSKISAIAKIIAPDDPQSIPKPEPHCNCIHCQIARAINQGLEAGQTPEDDEKKEDEIKEEDLTFRQWDISQSGDKLYTVINRLDSKEKYSVYLGHPVGCTCGKQGCEHILAVLKS
jgi:hypothetical protein